MKVETMKKIAKKVEVNLEELFKYTSKEKLNGFSYAVSTIKNEISNISFFDFDEELTNKDLEAIYRLIMQ